MGFVLSSILVILLSSSKNVAAFPLGGLYITPILIWIFLLLKEPNGQHLFNIWFWENQVGRLSGSSTSLGHINKSYISKLGIFLSIIEFSSSIFTTIILLKYLESFLSI